MVAARFATVTPSGSLPTAESLASKWPLTKTSRGPATFLKTFFSSASLAAASVVGSNTGLNGSRAIGATLVKRQSSSCNVGKPSSVKRARPALRSGSNQDGWIGSDSKRRNFSRNSLVALPAFFCAVGVIFVSSIYRIKMLNLSRNGPRRKFGVQASPCGTKGKLKLELQPIVPAPQTCFRARNWQFNETCLRKRTLKTR